MRLKNKLEIDSTLKVGAIPTASTSNFSVLFENEGTISKRVVGDIINKNSTDFIQGISNSFPSIFNYNTSTTPSDSNLVVSFKNQLAGTVFAAPTTLNGTPSFRKLIDSDLSETSIFSQLGNYVTLDTEQDITGKKTFSNAITRFGSNIDSNAHITLNTSSTDAEFWIKGSNSDTTGGVNVFSAYVGGAFFGQRVGSRQPISFSSRTSDDRVYFNLSKPSNDAVVFLATSNSNDGTIIQAPQSSTRVAFGYFVSNALMTGRSFINRGAGYFSGVLDSNGFIKHGQTNDSVLLAGGGHRPVSDFALATDIPDVSGFVPNTRIITAGNGLSGGGNLTANRTFTLGTPSSIGLSTTNAVTSSSHTHALDAATTTAINNGQTAFGWGNHALVGYLTTTALNNYYQSGDVNIPAKGGDYVVFPETGSGQLANFDFDTITTTGFYNKLFNAGAASTYNAPKTGYYGHVEVSNHGGNILQITRPYRVSDGMWMRNRFSGNWTPWVEFIHSGNLSSYANSLLTDFVPTSRTITINGVTQNLSANRTWTVPDTITRLRGTSSGTYTSGDLTLLAGANTTITQSGSNITIASTNTNTTYSAGTGLSLTGTTFGQTITTSGTGTFVTGITQTTNGFQVNLGTPPNTTYSAGTLALLQAGTNTSNRVWSPKILADGVIRKGVNNVNPEGQPFSIEANNGRLTLGNWGKFRFEEFGDQDCFFEFRYDEGPGLVVGHNHIDYEGTLAMGHLRFYGNGVVNTLSHNLNGYSRTRLPATGSAVERVLAVGATMGGSTYYANDNGLIDLPSSDGILSYSSANGIIVTDWNSFALSEYAMSLGYGSVTSGNYATSVGGLLSTTGFGSTNQGYSNSITKALGYSLGAYNSVRATLSGVFGIGLVNRNDGAFIVGRYNSELPIVPYDTTSPHTQAVFAIGAGRDDTDRYTALTVFGDGRADYTEGYDDSNWNNNTLVTKKWVLDNAGGGLPGYRNVNSSATFDLSAEYTGSVVENVYNIRTTGTVTFIGGNAVYDEGYKITIMTYSTGADIVLDSSQGVEFISSSGSPISYLDKPNRSVTFIYDKDYGSFRVYHVSELLL